MRYLMTFAYDGTAYLGYQKQPNGKTIQETIETNLSKINGNQFVSLHASGRTDAHVHAYGQTAHFDMQKRIDIGRLQHALNQMLPNDIFISKVEEVDDIFHARFDVKAKEYIYKINVGTYNPFERNYVYQYNRYLDISKIASALHYLEGTHNFKAFTKIDEDKESYERTIYQVSLHYESDLLIISFLGSGFLRYMVRNMIGTLLEIGEGKKEAQDIIKILESKDRTKAGVTAPPEGLYLNKVYYEDVTYGLLFERKSVM